MVDEIKTEDIDSWSLDGNARCGSKVSLPTAPYVLKGPRGHHGDHADHASSKEDLSILRRGRA